MNEELYTIGHSTHSINGFIKLLKDYNITAVCDVRSSPYSKFNPQFNRESLKYELKINKIAYVYLGKELGPRSKDENDYVNGKVQYDFLEKSDSFKSGIKRIMDGIHKYKVALMCSEKDPIECHRTILICKNLRNKKLNIKHIHFDGNIELHHNLEKRLLNIFNIPEHNLFSTYEELLEEAYKKQANKIAYTKEESEAELSQTHE